MTKVEKLKNGIVLVLGGTKTGKTTFAENRAKDLEFTQKNPVIYIATARVIDSEMKVRIEKHRNNRPSRWKTIEEPLEVSLILNNLKNEKCTIILDCLTLLTTNLLFEYGKDLNRDESESLIMKKIDEIIISAKELKGELIIISNQVENSLVSEYEWTRMFQDITGLVHQKLAAAAKEVYIMNAGIPLKLK